VNLPLEPLKNPNQKKPTLFFGRILLLSTALIVSINTIAGGRSSERNLMDDFLQDIIQPRKSPTTKTFTLKHPYKTRVAPPHISTN
jgi:hypothetical protein